VRFPNALYLTLRNTDAIRTALEMPVTFNYWIEPVDPSKKVEEFTSEIIQPEFVLNVGEPLPSRESNS